MSPLATKLHWLLDQPGWVSGHILDGQVASIRHPSYPGIRFWRDGQVSVRRGTEQDLLAIWWWERIRLRRRTERIADQLSFVICRQLPIRQLAEVN